jgi:hypothetical protein
MRTSEQIADLAAALAKAQGAFINPEKNKPVKVYGTTKSGKDFEYTFNYADFTAIVDSIRKPLSDNGLSFVQTTDADEYGHLVTTRLLHATGQWIEFDTRVFVGGPGAQAFGSGVTYAKRYALSSLLGVTADEDDDANASEGNKVDMRERPPRFAVQGRTAAAAREIAQQTGNAKSQYQVDKAKKAAEWVAGAIETVGKLPSERAIGEWWGEHQAAIDRLEREHPAEFDRLTVAVDARRDQVPSVLAAG